MYFELNRGIFSQEKVATILSGRTGGFEHKIVSFFFISKKYLPKLWFYQESIY